MDIEIITIRKDQLLDAIEIIIDKKMKEYNTKDNGKTFITKRDITKMFTMSLSSVNNRINDKTLQPYYIGNRVLFDKLEVEECLKGKGDE